MKNRAATYKPSPAAIAMLENMATPGLSPLDGLHGRSAHGGATQTWAALYRHGLRDVNGLTAEGYAAIAKARSKKATNLSAG